MLENWDTLLTAVGENILDINQSVFFRASTLFTESVSE